MPSLEQDTESELAGLVGATVAGKYRVDRIIGRGGMGAVFQATNLAIGKRVALKFLGHEAAQNREACQRFQREAEAAGMATEAGTETEAGADGGDWLFESDMGERIPHRPDSGSAGESFPGPGKV